MTHPMRVAYLLLHFPYFTETFVAEEILALKNLNFKIRIHSLLQPRSEPVHPVSEELQGKAHYTPGLFSLSLWLAQFYYFFKSPRLYFQLLVRLLRSPYSRGVFVSIFKRLLIFVKAVTIAYDLRFEDIQVIHTHFAWYSGAAAWICSNLLKIPFTITVHAFDLFVSTDFLSLLCTEAAHVVVISDFNRRVITELNVRSEKTISVIHCGVDLNKIPSNVRLDRVIHSPETFRILSVGSLTAKKGHHILLEACKILRDEGGHFQCNIYGSGSERDRLLNLIDSYGLDDRVTLHGAQVLPKIEAAYAQHDVFVLSSVVAPSGDQDGIPVVLMEAGGFGLPIISTEVSGIPEIIRMNETGLIVPPGDARKLADAISNLASNPEKRRELGKAARELVSREFNIELSAKQLADVFSQVSIQAGVEKINDLSDQRVTV